MTTAADSAPILHRLALTSGLALVRWSRARTAHLPTADGEAERLAREAAAERARGLLLPPR